MIRDQRRVDVGQGRAGAEGKLAQICVGLTVDGRAVLGLQLAQEDGRWKVTLET